MPKYPETIENIIRRIVIDIVDGSPSYPEASPETYNDLQTAARAADAEYNSRPDPDATMEDEAERVVTVATIGTIMPNRTEPAPTYTYDEVEIAKRTAARAAATPTRYEARCGGRLVAYGPTVDHVAAIAAEITFHEVYTGPDGVTHRTEVIR